MEACTAVTRATLYIEQGVPIAVNVGDAMNALSIGALTENIPVLGAELAYRIAHEAQHLVLQSVEVQALDVAYRDAPSSVDRDFIRELIPFLGERDI